MDFIDEAKIYVASGDGGNGCVSFRREKYVPMGGPDGGSGGKGADIVFVCNSQLSTLRDFKYRQHYRAQNGQPGGGKQMTGRSGRDLRIEVPMGTLLIDDQSQKVLADLKKPQEEILIAQGGQGGRGNLCFTSSTVQAPRYAEEGQKGQEITLRLSLKLLADVALVGSPNSGKSTLLSAISQAKPKIADYPFTTMTPQLGVVSLGPSQPTFVVADIPGLIKGAHEGKGLGLRFLKHLERSHLLWFVIDIGQPDSKEEPVKIYQTLRQELQAYDESLSKKPHMVVLNKMDLNPPEEIYRALSHHCQKNNIPWFLISGATQKGVKPLLGKSAERLVEIKDSLN